MHIMLLLQDHFAACFGQESEYLEWLWHHHKDTVDSYTLFLKVEFKSQDDFNDFCDFYVQILRIVESKEQTPPFKESGERDQIQGDVHNAKCVVLRLTGLN